MKIDDYQKPVWATLCRALGCICFLGFGAVILSDKYIKASETITFLALGVGSFIHFFFIAWCVETFADIRHYARETAIALTSGKEEEKKEDDDTKPTDYGSGEVPFRPSAWSVD